MFKTLLKNKKAQNTAEYALLIALVIAGVIAMQTYAQRALQARVRDTVKFTATKISDQVPGFGNTLQYEPNYLQSQYAVARDQDETVSSELGGETTSNGGTNRSREAAGFQSATYNGVTGE